MPKHKSIIGNKYDSLLVVSEEKHEDGRYYSNCICDCGNKKVIRSTSLVSGLTKSCGCKTKILSNISRNRNGNGITFNKYDLSGEYGIGYTSKNEEFYFDIEDYDKIKDYSWFINNKGYVKANESDKTIFMHRIVIKEYLTEDKNMVDHIYHVNKDNRKSQLRVVNSSENQMNKDTLSSNTSGHPGVSFHKGSNKWIAQIGINGELKYLGVYNNKDDAIKVRIEAEKNFFNEYAYKTK